MFKQAIAGFVIGLFATACAVESGDELPETSTTEQSIIWLCDGTDQWVRRWYNSSGVETGKEVCSCTELTRLGQIGGTYQQTWTGTCGGGGGGGGGGGCAVSAPAELRAPADDDGASIILPPPPPPPC